MSLRWDPPGDGGWGLETLHVSGAQPRVFQEAAPAGFKAGFSRMAARYGLPIDYLDTRFVNDHLYARMQAIGPPDFPLRAETAAAALAARSWHGDVERWEGGLRDEMLGRGRSLQGEPIETVSDEELLDHLARTVTHLQDGIALHFELMPVHNIPVGRLLLAARGWGLADADVFALLAGSSPASTGSAAALARIADACRDAGVVPESLDDVRNASAAARDALDAYLADHAWRAVTQYTPKAPALIEMPRVLIHAIRSAGAAAPAVTIDPGPTRARVPVEARAAFDELLADARRCYGVRDDNVGLTFMWPNGLVRRALLEIGRRLAERGGLVEPAHVFHLGQTELAAALTGEAMLADEAAARADRAVAAEAVAPGFLGDPEGPPPDSSLLPPAMAELSDALMIGFALEAPGGDTWTGDGVGIGRAPYTGRACVAATPERALELLEPGDVLVTSATTPAFEAVIRIAGAVVTEQGGLMGHTAIVCREYDIPAVIGVAGATENLTHGTQVTVDPAAGRVGPAGTGR